MEIWEWLVQTDSIQELWDRQPTYLLVQACYLFGALMTFLHGWQSKDRWLLLWCCTIMHGLVVEALCFFLPADVADNYWHSQTPLMFFGGRLPLHIVFLYPCFYYQATAAVNKFKFSTWTEPFAVALLVLLLDLPYDIVSVKFVHWTWHDTDPNLFDRHYWVPWNSYFFHASFSASFTFWFHFARFKAGTTGRQGLSLDDGRTKKWERWSITSEVSTLLVTSILGSVGGTLVFLLVYHPLHDGLGIHSEVTFFILFATFCLIVWRALTFGDASKKHSGLLSRDFLLLSHLLVHFSVFLLLTIFAHPENEISVGTHQQVGPCDETIQFPSASGKLLTKGRYLCLENYTEAYFDFHCSPGLPPPYSRWYTICGTAFTNRAEYIVIATLLTLIAGTVFGSIYLSPHGSNDLSQHGTRDIKAKRA